MEENGLTVDSRRSVITDAGEVVPSFTLAGDGVEFFCHSPFIKHVDDSEDMRNEAALIFNIRFQVGDNKFDYFMTGDSEWEVLSDIVEKSKIHKNEDRLAWDLYSLPHHCSYKTLSDEKGETETIPKPSVKELLLSGKEGAHIVSSSLPIEDTKAGSERSQPPHIQAKKCYLKHLKEINGGKFFVTMEEPNEKKPEPLIFKIEATGISREAKVITAANIITSSPAPKAG